ncbi:uncharacterized protein LOC122387894 [Amphibalanus amphitrite]|uniref:uncharacterized protein LOC122387894 n=1 Tax=Amphibalanus amphitrite TaxID=1232801 RepID=UPI001C908997|nr:uncharacterized protein LOC122387894 [Amphibalanus amphitrite]
MPRPLKSNPSESCKIASLSTSEAWHRWTSTVTDVVQCVLSVVGDIMWCAASGFMEGVCSAIRVPVICLPLQRPLLPPDVLQSFSHLELADPPSDRQLSVDLLVGLDSYWDFIRQGEIRLSGGPVAQETSLGWVISGKVSGKSSGGVTSQLLCLGDIHEHSLRRLWSLEGIGVCDSDDAEQDQVLKEFSSSVVKADGRYQVALPWKAGAAEHLMDNRPAAEARLQGLSRRLARDPELGAAYSEALQEMESAGVIEEVPSHQLDVSRPTFYLPHRPVVKESSESTRVRPVFDASAAGPNGVSLNECLEVGPCLIPSLVDVLLRFRRWQVAVTADISKAFLQLSLKVEDRDVHRFLWVHEGRTRVMRFRRVTFGVRSSPFLLNATIRHHLSKSAPSRAVREMAENFYVDDLLSGADSEEEASSLLSQAQDVMAGAGMTLTKCVSNSAVVFDKTHAANGSGERESSKVLGVMWRSGEDVFSYEGLTVAADVTPTKRVVLSCIARLFDPLGFVAPFVMVAKSLFQELWQLGLAWDQVIPADRSQIFSDWLRGVDSLKQLRIPRCYSTSGWRHGEGVSLHAFGDASPRGYGAVVYLRTARPDGSGEVRLVLAKARLAPLKRVTVPRLELLGSLLAARLVALVRQALRLPEDTVIRCWSDSMIALGWIRGDPQRWKQFVANRVRSIQSLTTPSDWGHCPGDENPADLTTRRVSAAELLESEQWWSGPSWLASPRARPDSGEACDEPTESGQVTSVPVEVRSETAEAVGGSCLVAGTGEQPVFCTTRWSSLSKAVRVVGWVRRFCNNARNARQKCALPDLSSDEVVSARLVLLREEQRLAFAAELKALQQAYWIVGLRCLAKRVKRFCVSCKRQDALACNKPAAPLPRDRVTRAPPFAVTGVDFAGPIFAVDFPRRKFYVCLFTCAVTRAVHLELTASLCQAEFLMALRRFAARRGLPSVIYSDNARTFCGADAMLTRYFGHLAPKWKFIVPRSPWWGGWWERLVRTVKVGLRKSCGSRCLSRTELETVLLEVEACINSRPLTPVTDSLEGDSPLTPSHFLTGRGTGFQSRVLEDPEAVNAKMLSGGAASCVRRCASRAGCSALCSTLQTRAKKKSPSCLRRCMMQGLLHPAQCHSLC